MKKFKRFLVKAWMNYVKLYEPLFKYNVPICI